MCSCLDLSASLPLAVDPGFYCPNWLYLGKCHLQLGHREEARRWLEKAAEHRSDLAEDREVSLPHLAAI